MMSPAIKQMMCKVAGAGLLLAAMTCAAENNSGAPVSAGTINSPATDLTVVTTSAEAVTETQSESIQSSPSAQTPSAPVDVQAASSQINNQTNKPPYYQHTGNSPQIGSGGHLLNVTLGLLLIVGLIFALSWFVKRFSGGPFSGNAHLKIIATMPLGTRERIVLIDAGGQQLLLGITPTHINTLHTFDTPIATGNDDVNTSEFGRKLMAILQRPNAGVEPENEPGRARKPDNKNNSGIRD